MSKLSLSAPSARRLAVASVCLLSLLSLANVSRAQTDKKKAAPAAPAKAAPAPAAKPSAPAAAARPASGGAAASTHTAAAPASHGPTTAGPAASGAAATHGPTTANPRGPTTANAGRPTTATPGGARGPEPGRAGSGNEMGHGGVAGPGARPAVATNRGGFGNRTPAGARDVRAPNGAIVRTRADGRRSDLHDERRGLDMHRNLDGNRRVLVERGDHSRVFAERGGRGYVQHPYLYHGREFGHRTYYYNGRYYDRYYNRYPYHGGYLDVYAPVRYYPAAYYGWAYNPWARPVAYTGWGWAGSPWYGYYGGYFAPYPTYAGPSYWLTDYLIAQSLQDAYAARAEADAAAAGAPAGPPVLTSETKDLIAGEVARQISLENAEAADNAAQRDIDPQRSSIAQLLSDNQPHVFVVGTDLDLVGSDGAECPVSQGDVLQTPAGAPPPDAATVNAVVLSSKGWRKECRISGGVTVAFAELQDMQNHMRETIDAGMGDLQAKQGKGGLPMGPQATRGAPVQAAFAAGAPPPDTSAQTEIAQQSQAADQAEQEVAGNAAPAAPGAAGIPASAAPPPAPIAVGQTAAEVNAAYGTPKVLFKSPAKEIDSYPNGVKVTYKNGKVSDVE